MAVTVDSLNQAILESIHETEAITLGPLMCSVLRRQFSSIGYYQGQRAGSLEHRDVVGLRNRLVPMITLWLDALTYFDVTSGNEVL